LKSEENMPTTSSSCHATYEWVRARGKDAPVGIPCTPSVDHNKWHEISQMQRFLKRAILPTPTSSAGTILRGAVGFDCASRLCGRCRYRCVGRKIGRMHISMIANQREAFMNTHQ